MILRFTMDFWIPDGFLDSQWILSFTMDFWINIGFVDSRYLAGFTIYFWICDGFLCHVVKIVVGKCPPGFQLVLIDYQTCSRFLFVGKMAPGILGSWFLKSWSLVLKYCSCLFSGLQTPW